MLLLNRLDIDSVARLCYLYQMRIHIVQKDTSKLDHTAYIQNAEKSGADLVCFAELSTSGILYQQEPVKPLETVLKSLKDHQTSIMLGLPYQVDETLYNCYMYYDRGQHQMYRKINLFCPMNEDKIYQAGDMPGLFKTRHGLLGVAICFDLRFPDLFKQLVSIGAEIIFVPAAFPQVRIEDWKRLLVQMAVENKVPVVGVNSVGRDSCNEFGGASMAVDATGNVLVSANETEETVLEVEIDL
ncbi:MAG: hypothetical protein KOO62_05605 [candidate division Zixibacteria bacterium]|nr:hypothetical protein [candidate division Zixibacteria bacterium]